ncbi:hypothetical protein QUF61_03475 [Candidatus Venteria ishoeyi]|uniref:Uncharacterized protein n=2 Tax=Candidatus Venteria ishoeyi TaxID=1899563 RepID=A0A1H6FDD2_9GAMM|nr:hypothetical protein [Candidatus Venteria ishoeyi]MDM8545534.1 hypothetical protein [Candidatus Venteria ishoeyi]SEH07034.1 Uncharacterised protein [Candidatus Venteria ishoeyi]
MNKMNCWEYKQCGREAGGYKVEDLGICPVTQENRTDTVNHGKNGGRSCWAIPGSLCENRVQGNYVEKLDHCMQCQFYKLILREEGMDFQIGSDILKRLEIPVVAA